MNEVQPNNEYDLPEIDPKTLESDVHAVDINANTQARELTIMWSDGKESKFAYLALQAACRSATFINERTGEQMIGIEDLDPDVTIVDMVLIGRYAIQFVWSNGMGNDGIYSWRYLRSLSSLND